MFSIMTVSDACYWVIWTLAFDHLSANHCFLSFFRLLSSWQSSMDHCQYNTLGDDEEFGWNRPCSWHNWTYRKITCTEGGRGAGVVTSPWWAAPKSGLKSCLSTLCTYGMVLLEDLIFTRGQLCVNLSLKRRHHNLWSVHCLAHQQ